MRARKRRVAAKTRKRARPSAKKREQSRSAKTKQKQTKKHKPPKKSVARRPKGDVALGGGVVLKADGSVEIAMTVLPSDLTFLEANEAFEAGDYERAIDGYTRALKDVEDPEMYYNRAMAKGRLEDYAGAQADYDRAIALKSTDSRYFGNRGGVRDVIGDHEGALADFTRALELEGGKSAQYFAWRGAVLYRIGRYDESAADFGKAAKHDPEWKDVFFDKGKAELRAGRAKDAEKSFTADLSRAPSGMGYFNRYVARKKQGKRQQALEDLDAAVELEPESAALIAQRGLFAFELQLLDRTASDMQRAVELARSAGEEIDAQWPLAAGVALSQLGRNQEALLELTTASELRPEEAGIWCNRGWVLHQLGQHGDAIVDLDRALALAPRYEKALFNRASARESLGDRDGALHDYRALAELGADVAQYIARLGG